MKIKDLKNGQKGVDLDDVEIIDIGETKEFTSKYGKKGSYAKVIVEDETGTITLTLWNDQIEKVNIGDRISVVGGFVTEYQDELQISTGKTGKIKFQNTEEDVM